MGRLVEVMNKSSRATRVLTEPLGEAYTLVPGARLRIASSEADLGDVYVWWSEKDLMVETQVEGDFSGVAFEVIGTE